MINKLKAQAEKMDNTHEQMGNFNKEVDILGKD